MIRAATLLCLLALTAPTPVAAVDPLPSDPPPAPSIAPEPAPSIAPEPAPSIAPEPAPVYELGILGPAPVVGRGDLRYFAPTEGGLLYLGLFGEDGPSEAAAWPDPASAGWSGEPIEGGLLRLRFGAEAGALSVTGFALGPDGNLAGTASVTLLPDREAPRLDGLTLTVERGALRADWREWDQEAGIARRDLVLERAAAEASCGDWRTLAATSQDASETPALALPMLEARSPETIASAPVGSGERGPAMAATLSPPGPGCYRLRLRLFDALGQAREGASGAVRFGPAPPVSPEPAPLVRISRYRPDAFRTQATFRLCTAAVVTTILATVLPRGSRLPSQAEIFAYEQAHSGLPDGATRRGATATGMAAALTRWSGRPYRALAFVRYEDALRASARAIARTGSPVALIVWGGRHAWTLHGFASATDPRTDTAARISDLWVSGPLWPRRARDGWDPRPDTRFGAAALASRFTPVASGRYLVVLPVSLAGS